MRPRVAGLHLQLLGLIILPFSLVVVIVATLGIRIHQQAMRQLVAERDERAARAAAAAISQELHHLESAMLLIQRSLDSSANVAQLWQEYPHLREDFDLGLAVLDPDAQVLASTVPAQFWDSRPIAPAISAPTSEPVRFLDPYPGPDGTEVYLLAAVQGGHLVGGFRPAGLMQQAVLSAMVEGEGSGAYLIDAAGKLLDRLGDLAPPDLIGHAGVQAALRGEVGSVYLPGEDGEHVVAFSPIAPTGWALIIEEPWQSVSSPLLDASLVAPLAVVPALLVTLVALWVGSRQVIGPLRRLQELADRLQLDDPSTIEEPVGGIAEVRQLQITLNRMTERLHSAQTALQRYIGAVTEAQEEERRRLARELHDETIQDLIAVDQSIQMLAMEPRGDELSTTRQLEELHRALNQATQEVRRLIQGLRPIYLEDLGLVPAIEMLAAEVGRDGAIQLEVQTSGRPRRLRAGQELAIYRIVQEALNNLVRHSQARRAALQIAFGDDEVSFALSDDGVGFETQSNLAELAAEGRFGLIGMRERAMLAGARLDIRSRPGEGTAIRLALPYGRGDGQPSG